MTLNSDATCKRCGAVVALGYNGAVMALGYRLCNYCIREEKEAHEFGKLERPAGSKTT